MGQNQGDVLCRKRFINLNKIRFSIYLLILPVLLGATKYAGEFLSLGYGSQALSMGGIEASITGSHTFYSNPAAMIYSKKSISVTHSSIFSGNASYNGFGILLPEENRALGFGLIHLGISGIPNTINALRDYGEDGLPNTNDPGENNGILDPGEWLDYDRVSYFSDDDYLLFLSYAHTLRENLSWGVGVKGIYRKIGDYSSYGVGTDIGLYYLAKYFNFAAVLKNATTTYLSWSTGTSEIVYPSMKTGVIVKAPLSWENTMLSVGIEFDVYFEGREIASQWNISELSFDNHLGVELSVKEKFFLRAGSNFGHLTAGGALQYKSIMFDYAFMSHQQLGSTHRISLIYFR